MPIDTSRPGIIGGAMALDDMGNIYATYVGSPPIIIERSTNHGISWTRSEFGGPELSRVPRDIVVDHDGNVWLLWVSWQDEFAPAILHLSKSIDSGKTFTTLFSSFSYFDGQLFQKLAVDVHNSIYMLWDDAQFKLTKFLNGDTTNRVDADIPNDTLRIGSYPKLVISRESVVHCVWEGSYYEPVNGYHEFVFYSRSNDTGLTFTGRTRVDTSDRVGSYYVHYFPALAVDSVGTIFVSYRRFLGPNSDIRFVKSNDNGQTFTPPKIMSDSNAYYESRLTVDSENGIDLLWDTQQGPWHARSSDGGNSFTTPVFVGAFGLHDLKSSRNGFLYATGEHNSQMYFSKTDVTLSIDEKDVNPRTFALLPNYPNPFNSSTTIRFSIGTASPVEVRIFDLTGREIEVLLSKYLSPGTYSIAWNANRYSSGVYFVRVTAGKEIAATQKIIYMR